MKWLVLAINVVGGLGVLGSYWYGFATTPDPGALWGGVPEWMKPAYTVSMLTAAVGYFPPLIYILRLDAERVRVGGFGYAIFAMLYALVLAPSALWMPLTFAHVDAPNGALWAVIRGVLFAVALGALGQLAALVRARPRGGAVGWGLAIAGQLAFCVQTALLDPLVWPAYWVHVR